MQPPAQPMDPSPTVVQPAESPEQATDAGTPRSAEAAEAGPLDIAQWVPRVFRFAIRLTKDVHAAEDLTQETFLRAWKFRHQLKQPAAARVWLFRIAHRLWTDGLRRRTPLASDPRDFTQQADVRAQSPLLAASGADELAQAMAALDALPQRQREVLYLAVVEQLPLVEVAEVLEISPENTRACLSLARKRMRELLQG